MEPASVAQSENRVSDLLFLAGGAGVEGGQGDVDYIYGSHDMSDRLMPNSGLGDVDSKEFGTGDLQVNPNPIYVVL